MKKVFIALFMVAVSTASFAQFKKGTFLVGGSSGLGRLTLFKEKVTFSTSSSSGKSTSFELEPSAGYFIIDNLAVGAGLGISASSFKPDGNGAKSSQSTIVLSPFGRYYFNKFYAQGSIQFGSGKSKSTFNTTSETYTAAVSGFSLLVGYALALNEYVTFEPQVGYGSVTSNDKDRNIKIVNSGPLIRMGIFIYIAR